MNYGVRNLPQELQIIGCWKENIKSLYAKEQMKSLKIRHAKSPGRFEKDPNKLLKMKIRELILKKQTGN